MTACEELEHYASFDNTEWGETMLQLVSLRRRSPFISSELVEALDKEINSNLEYVRKNATIVEELETTTRTYKYLEWYD